MSKVERASTVAQPQRVDTIPSSPLRFVLHFMVERERTIVFVLALVAGVLALLEAGGTFAFGSLINALAGGGAGTLISASPETLFLIVIVMWLLPPFLSRMTTAYLARFQSRLRGTIHDEVLGYVLGHAPRFFLDEASGSIGHRIRTAALAAYYVFEFLFFRLARFVVLLVVALAMTLSQTPNMVPAFIGFVLAFTAISYWAARLCWPYGRELSAASSAQSGRKVDIVSNWDAVLSFSRATFERILLTPISMREQRAKIRWTDSVIVMGIVLHWIAMLLVIVVGWQSFVETRAGTMSVGLFTTIVTLALLIAGHLTVLGEYFLTFSEQYTQLADCLDAIAKPHEIIDLPGAQSLRVTAGAVEFRDLHFAYAEGMPVFAGLNLSIRSGERVGLVGPSGAGKSTLIKLLRRQFLWQRGQVLIDGQDVAAVTWDSLHNAVAEVPQSPNLFHRTVRENIAYGHPAAPDSEIIQAAQLAHAHDFITVRPKGYDAVVGEKGMKLSGGERQRIAIARAFLKNAPILVLDEATSSLDSDAEHLIQEALLSLMKGRTVIAIAHRLSTIMHLDRIVVLDQGRIVEQGSHAELLTAAGPYARLWKRQAGGFI